MSPSPRPIRRLLLALAVVAAIAWLAVAWTKVDTYSERTDEPAILMVAIVALPVVVVVVLVAAAAISARRSQRPR